MPGVTVAVHDAPENILERITFYDIDSRRIEKHLTEEEWLLYLKEIKADIISAGPSPGSPSGAENLAYFVANAKGKHPAAATARCR